MRSRRGPIGGPARVGLGQVLSRRDCKCQGGRRAHGREDVAVGISRASMRSVFQREALPVAPPRIPMATEHSGRYAGRTLDSVFDCSGSRHSPLSSSSSTNGLSVASGIRERIGRSRWSSWTQSIDRFPPTRFKKAMRHVCLPTCQWARSREVMK